MEKVKVKEGEFLRVCRLAKLVERKAKIPTFVTVNQLEGLELSAGKIISFWIKNPGQPDQEKVYDQPVNDKQIAAVIGAFETPSPKPKEEKKNEQPKSENKEVQKETVSLINSIPDILEEKRIITPQDVQEWKGKSTFDRILWFQKTPKGLIKQRRGFVLPEFAGRDKQTLTDANFKMFSYIPADAMKKSANIAFCFQWSSVVEETHWFPDEVAVRGYIQVEIDGKMYQRPCGGSMVKKGIMDWGDTLEGAISEMLKRGIYHFLHGDVKRGEAGE